MSTTLSTEAAADKAHDTNRTVVIPFEALGLDTAIPEAVRALAETTVTETREAYERSKTVLETGLETLERSFDAIGHTSVALNRKAIEIAHRNVGSGFDLAKSLAGAKNLAENLELQAAYWREQFGVLMAQAEELRALSTKVTTDAAEPIEQYTTHQAEELRALSAKMADNAAEPIKTACDAFGGQAEQGKLTETPKAGHSLEGHSARGKRGPKRAGATRLASDCKGDNGE